MMSDQPQQSRRSLLSEVIVLFAILLVGLLLRQYFFSGLVASDDMRHAYHGYFLFSSPAEKYDVVHLPDKTLYYRMGVNLPIWVSSHIFGPSLWALALPSYLASLGVVLLIYLLLRSVIGPSGGLIGAALAACIPIDVYIAGTVLQDCLFAFLLTVALACVVWAESAKGTRRYTLLLIAGLALGYQQYVKENAVYVLGLFGLWAIVQCIVQKRVLFRYLMIPLGFLLMQVCFCLLFWYVKGDFFFYGHHLRRIAELNAEGTPKYGLSDIVRLCSPSIIKQWQLGYWFAAFPVLLILAMCYREFRFRALLLILFVGQLYSYYQPSRWTPTSRYMIQFTVPYVIILAVGLHWLVLRTPKRLRLAVAGLAVIAAGVGMALPLNMRYHEYGPHRGMGHRVAHAYLLANGAPNDPVYVDTQYGAYTERALYQLSGYKAPLGGFIPLTKVGDADHGWVVLGSTELRRRRGHKPYSTPGNWLEVNRYETTLDGKLRWVAVYKILPPQPTPDALAFVPADGYVSLDALRLPVVPEGLGFTPLPLTDAPDLHKWSTSITPIRVENESGVVVCHVGGESAKKRQVGGVLLDVKSPQAVRATLGFSECENIERVHIALLDRHQRVLCQWCWFVKNGVLPLERPLTMTFVPSKPTGRFEPLGEFEKLGLARSLGVWISVKPMKEATLRVHEVSVGLPVDAATASPATAESEPDSDS